MVQDWTSHFSIIFNEHDQIQGSNFFKTNKCDHNQPKKCNQLEQLVKTWSDLTFCDHNQVADLIKLHLLLFITRKYTFIYAKSYINNVNNFFINSRIHFISVDRISIRIFEYVSIFNNVNWQRNARSDILSGNFIVIYIKIYFNNTNQQTIAFIDKYS